MKRTATLLSHCLPARPDALHLRTARPGDTTLPVITLTEPTNATLISVVPPL